jgi:hypothetical protein
LTEIQLPPTKVRTVVSSRADATALQAGVDLSLSAATSVTPNQSGQKLPFLLLLVFLRSFRDIPFFHPSSVIPQRNGRETKLCLGKTFCDLFLVWGALESGKFTYPEFHIQLKYIKFGAGA